MKKAIYVQCTGEAHSNLYIDNCASCMPYWERYPTCPDDGTKLLESGYCRKCKRRFELTKKEVAE